MEELRDLARGIYPPLLASVGLVAALEAQASQAPVPTVLTADRIGRYQQDLEAAVYFCVLEALQNVAKYAGADAGRGPAGLLGDDLGFEVSDDGVGFDLDSRAFGTGLQGIADRVGTPTAARSNVRSAPGAGTAIGGRLPCRALEAAG